MPWIQVYDPLGNPWLSTAAAALPIALRQRVRIRRVGAEEFTFPPSLIVRRVHP